MTTLLLGPASAAFGIQIPNPGSEMFLQTSGPNAPITIGDFYSSPAGGDTDHVFILRVPSDWPAGVSVTVALYDPELAGPDPVAPRALDEIRSAADSSTFRLESPSGSTVASATYSNSSTNGLWVELATFDPGVTGTGTYELHVTVSDDDDNSWRVAASHDPDCVVGGSCASALLENGNETDTAPGGSATLAMGVLRTSYQHDGLTVPVCVDHAFFVGPATPRPLLAHNFDMDGAGSVVYTSPGGGSVTGTVSGNGRWNGSGDATRVGDLLPDANGWWTAKVCISRGNQYVFEAPGAATFHGIPPTPRLTVTKDDGVSSARVGDDLTYTITVANVSDGDSFPGTAYNVALRDALPAGTGFVSCVGPAGVVCSEASGTIAATLTEPLVAGSSISVDVTVTVGPEVAAQLTNEAVVRYEDSLENLFPEVRGSDTDSIDFVPILTIAATGTLQMLRGDTATMSFSISHGAASDGSPIFNPTVTCDICDTLVYGSGDTDNDGVLDAGETWLYDATVLSDGSSPDPLVAAVAATGTDRAGVSLSDTTSHEIDLVDPGSIAGAVFEDMNGNGVLDAGEPKFDGVSVELGNGGGPVDTTVTVTGDYAFDRLYPDGYDVSVDESTLPSGLVGTTANPLDVDLVEGSSITGVDFGYARPVTLSGTVFADANFDTALNPGEAGIAGVIVTLLDGSGYPVESTTSGANGEYSFSMLPGVYSLAISSGLPAGWALTTPGSVELGQLVSGDVVEDIDFGAANHAPALIGDSQTVEFGQLPEPLVAIDPEDSPVTFRLAGGVLPTGLTLNADGTFSGQSLESGVFDLVIEVCDNADPVACAEFPYQLEVLAAPVMQGGTTQPPTPVIGTTVNAEALPFTGFETSSVIAIGVGLLFVGYILLSGAGFDAVGDEE